MSTNLATNLKTVIVDPECRGGATAPVHVRPSSPRPHAPDSYMAKVLADLRNDQNLIYLATRLQSYADLCESRLGSLRQAVADADHATTYEVAHALTDLTSRLGAIALMKLCIALQMMARRGLQTQAQQLMAQLDAEFQRFKQSLISAVG